MNALARLDVRISLWLQARRSRAPNFLFAALSWSGAAGVWFSTAAALIVTARLHADVMPRQPEFLAAMGGAFTTLVVGGVIKSLAGRRRPFASKHGITAAIWAPGVNRSFPSTHAATTVALATSLLVMGHPLAWPITLWAIGVSFSRVWLGVHYATDVLAGSVLGLLFGFIPWATVLRPLAPFTIG